MLQVMTKLKWNRISIVHENNLYGVNGAQKLRNDGAKLGICFVNSYGVDVKNGVDSNQITEAITDILAKKITGLIFFGGPISVKVFFQDLNSRPIIQIPIVMVSEGANMDRTALQSYSGHFFSNAKGLLGVAPLYRQVQEFQSYWKSIFTSSERFNSSVTSDPWLQDVFDEVTGCKQTNCQFKIINDPAVLEKHFKSQPLFVQYAILAAHAMAKTITNYCQTTPSLCSGVVEDFRPGHLVDKVKGLTIDFKNDFEGR